MLNCKNKQKRLPPEHRRQPLFMNVWDKKGVSLSVSICLGLSGQNIRAVHCVFPPFGIGHV